MVDYESKLNSKSTLFHLCSMYCVHCIVDTVPEESSTSDIHFKYEIPNKIRHRINPNDDSSKEMY